MKTVMPLCGKDAARLLKEHGSGEILGIYSAGTYLLFPDSGLLLITDRCRGYIPFGIGIHNYADFRDAISGKCMTEVKIINNSANTALLNFGGCAEILAELNGAIPCCSLTRAPKPEDVRNTARLLLQNKQSGFAPVASTVLPEDERLELADPFVSKAAALTDSLLEALKCENAKNTCDAVRGLVGLGHGLTPSGDDMLCGMLYCLHYNKWIKNGKEAASLLSHAVTEALAYTNTVSRRYLLAAAEGEYFSAVAELAEALSKNSDALPASLSRLLEIGSSSGADIATGMIMTYCAFME